jgi:hypothetical protein
VKPFIPLAIGLFANAVTPIALAQEKPVTTAPQPPKAPLLAPSPNHQVTLSKDAIGKEFLFSASIIPQAIAPTSTALAGKIVRFELFHDGVDLYEATEGLVVTKDLPARRLLTTFPIIAQDERSVIIDFNAGMRRVFSEMWIPSSSSSIAQSRTLEIPQSRVFSVTLDGDLLSIRQSAQVRDRQNDPNREDRYEIRYFLTPYNAGKFKSKEHSPTESKHVRFFEIQPQIEPTSGRPTSLIALFDISKPVTIHYSANTPAEYEAAVKNGILYWNRAFGREVIKAEKAPAGVTAPDSQRHMVQWVPWDSAGYAYADIILDPRSGASRRGQAYMTSTFAISGRARARAVLRNLRSAAALEPKPAPQKQEASEISTSESATPARQTTPPLFASARTCYVDAAEFSEQFAASLEGALADPTLDDATIKRMSQDYVCEVVAHEVGHMLGLRHNFAGSLGTSLSHKELTEWFKAYVGNDETKTLADRIPATSVMDYNDLKSSAYIGWKIRTTKEVLPYDKAAIQWGYFNGQEVVEKKSVFGTDQDVLGYADVQRFDYGAEPVLSAYASIGDEVRNLPVRIIEEFIATKAPRDPRDRRPLEQVSLDPVSAANRIGSAYGRLLSWFQSATRSLNVEKEFPFVGTLNRKDVLLAYWKSLNAQVEKLGGIDRSLFAFLPIELKLELKTEPSGVEAVEKIDAKKLTERLGKLLETKDYTDFVGLDEKPTSFSKEDKELILKRGAKFFEEYEKECLKAVCGRLERTQRNLGVQAQEEVSDDDIVAKLERRIVDLSRELVMARSESKTHRGKVDKATVEVAEFRYDLETRMAASRMLNDGAGSFRKWCTEARTDLGKQLKEAVDGSLNIQNLKEFKEQMLSRTLRDWYLNQQSVIGVLNGGAPPPPPMPAPSAPKPPHAGGEPPRS